MTEPELRVFRKAGGLNNDWDMAYTLIALRLAGRANSQKELAAAAAESGGRGRAWAAEILPRRVRLDYDLVVQIFNEYYWGAEQFERVFDLPARIEPPQPGLWQREVQLLPADLPERLRAAGVRAFGIATGRTQDELNLVFTPAGLDQFIPPAHIVTADTLSKPDGRVLERVLAAMQQHRGAGGSTANPHGDLLRRYYGRSASCGKLSRFGPCRKASLGRGRGRGQGGRFRLLSAGRLRRHTWNILASWTRLWKPSTVQAGVENRTLISLMHADLR